LNKDFVLREYQPGRWARVDPRTGQVFGSATEADAWIRANLPHQVSRKAVSAGGNGNNGDEVYFVAMRDSGEKAGMVPASDAGRLALYPDLGAARANAGALGVAAPMRWPRVVELCRRHGLALPE